MNSEKISFLKRHPLYTLSCVSEHYRLNKEMLEKYQNVLNWELVGQNENIKWSISLIDGFFPNLTSQRAKFSTAFCWNSKLPWSVDFIKRYLLYWDWEGLAENEVVKNHKGILA